MLVSLPSPHAVPQHIHSYWLGVGIDYHNADPHDLDSGTGTRHFKSVGNEVGKARGTPKFY